MKTLLSLDIALTLKSAVPSYEVDSQVRWVDEMSCKIGFVSEIYKIWYPTQELKIHTYHPCYAASSPYKRPL